MQALEEGERMARTFNKLLFHIIFSTKERAPLITSEIRDDLHAYLGGIVRELGGRATLPSRNISAIRSSTIARSRSAMSSSLFCASRTLNSTNNISGSESFARFAGFRALALRTHGLRRGLRPYARFASYSNKSHRSRNSAALHGCNGDRR